MPNKILQIYNRARAMTMSLVEIYVQMFHGQNSKIPESPPTG